MNYSKKQIDETKRLASIYLPIRDIAMVIGVPAETLREDIAVEGSDISTAYYTGKLASKMKLHSQEMKLAKIGSPLALENTKANLLLMEDDE